MINCFKVPSTCLFNLLLSLETPSPDPLNIDELVKEEKPLKAIDFCYHDENEMVTVLDCISLCVMVIAYAPDSVRGQQMLVRSRQIIKFNPCVNKISFLLGIELKIIYFQEYNFIIEIKRLSNSNQSIFLHID